MILAVSTLGVIAVTVVATLVLMLLLITVLLITKEKLSPSGPVKILINDERELEVSSGGTLLTTLSKEGIFLQSARGGEGTCVESAWIVLEGGRAATATD